MYEHLTRVELYFKKIKEDKEAYDNEEDKEAYDNEPVY